MTRALRFRLFVVAAIVLGAATLTPLASATQGGSPKQRPFKGFVKGFVTIQFAPGFPLVRDTFGGRCSVPSDWIAVWSGRGEATHMGVVNAFGSDCDRVDLLTGNVVYGDGTITEYGSNGDFLFGTYTNGHGTIGSTFSDEWTLTGGTGHFAGATGAGVETFDLLAPPVFSSTPQPFVNPWNGWISYGH